MALAKCNCFFPDHRHSSRVAATCHGPQDWDPMRTDLKDIPWLQQHDLRTAPRPAPHAGATCGAALKCEASGIQRVLGWKRGSPRIVFCCFLCFYFKCKITGFCRVCEKASKVKLAEL